MADETDKSLERLKELDLWCDRYEAELQKGERLSPAEFLVKHSMDTQHAAADLLTELKRIEAAYNHVAKRAVASDTEVFGQPVRKCVGRYELLRPLGSGGFGEVWVAFDPQLDREIAIKIPHPGVLSDAACIGRFYREAKSAAKLKHANIVRVHDAGSDGSTHFIAAEFISGKTLRELCSSGGMEIREAVRIVADLAGAVYYAHRNNIIHRDIKPGNILMDANQQPHLTDFGLASQLDASALTANGMVVGTPVYMAPEQAAGRFGAALPACDQYSLGTVLYELLTGRPPFSGSNSVVLYHKLNSAPAAPSTIRAEIPAEVEAICLKAMHRIPEERYVDCEAMAADLRAWLEGRSRSDLPKNKLSWPVTMAMLAVALSLILFAYLYWQNRLALDRSQARAALRDTPGDTKTNLHETAVETSSASSMITAQSTAQPPTPGNAEFVDAAFYLPLNSNVPRKVVEFSEIHYAKLDDAVAWMKSLGPDYLPSVIGEHVTASPKRYHVIAYRLSFPIRYRVDLARSLGADSALIKELEEKGYRAVAYGEQLYGVGPDGEFLRTCVENDDRVLTWIGRHAEFREQIENFKSNNYRPVLMIPKIAHDGGQRVSISIPDHAKSNWQAEQLLTLETLKEFAELSRIEKRFMFQICGEINAEKQLRFYATAFDNPNNLDWDYQLDMSTSEYEAELVRRKALGFRPTTVTSYGDPQSPQYAAAWIRYFHPAK